MTPERWQQIEMAFHQAVSIPAVDLPAFLAQFDPDTRHEVQSLLDAELLPLTLTGEVVSTIEDLRQQDPRNHQRLGPYRILGDLGSGGMGSVFKATRDDDAYQKTVAIKIIRANLAHTQLEQRFRAERQILAQLEHPYIARLIDGGAHDGLPYIVMEYIEGEPIDQYVQHNQLSIPDRIILFRKVCEAVQHAHNRLIVHRDLKPGNILVLPDGTPKLLDFGIAKLLDQETNSPDGPLTQTGWLMMTPDYASPEQVGGDAITVASDVYSLGVILYELLTGDRPYRLKTYSPSEIQQVICTGVIRNPNLESDLDNILLMALRLEPARRYASVDKLSDDLRRYLDGQPVSARPDTFLYRSTKFIQRNRLAVGLSAILLVSILTGAFLVYREGLRSQRRFTQVRAIANRVLTEFDVEAAKLPGSIQLRALMARASMEYLDSLAAESLNDPQLQFEVAYAYYRVGDTLGYPRSANLNLPFEAAIAYNKAIALSRQNPNGKKSQRLLALLYGHYAVLLPRLGKPEQAQAYFEKSIALLDPADAPPNFDVRHPYANQLLIEGNFDAASRIIAPLLAFPPGSVYVHAHLHAHNLASEIELNRGNISQAFEYTTKGLSIGAVASPAMVGLDRSLTLVENTHARLLFSHVSPSLWRACDAVPHARKAFEGAYKLFQLENADRLSAISAAACFYSYALTSAACNGGQPPELYERGLEIHKSMGMTSESVDDYFAYLKLRQGNYAAALETLQPHLKNSPENIDIQRFAAEAYLGLNRPAEAIRLLKPILAYTEKHARSSQFDAIIYRERVLPISLLLGDAYLKVNRPAEAAAVWQNALAAVPGVAGKFPPSPSTLHWQAELRSRLK